jgi:hypothetical protein
MGKLRCMEGQGAGALRAWSPFSLSRHHIAVHLHDVRSQGPQADPAASLPQAGTKPTHNANGVVNASSTRARRLSHVVQDVRGSLNMCSPHRNATHSPMPSQQFMHSIGRVLALTHALCGRLLRPSQPNGKPVEGSEEALVQGDGAEEASPAPAIKTAVEVREG